MWNIPKDGELSSIPKLYETEDIPLKEKVIHLHLFIGGCDWYIAEFDGEDLFWGFAILNNDLQSAEWGYISLNQLKEIKIDPYGFEIDRDLHWTPCRAFEVEKIREAQGWNTEGVIASDT